MVKAAPGDDCGRTWRGYLGEYEDGRGVFWTQAEAQAALDAALAADEADKTRVPFVPYSPRLPYGGELVSESIEHREKYSMGKGYYIEAKRANPWRVRKQRVTGSQWNSATNRHEDTGEPSEGTLYMLGKRHEHLLKPSAPLARLAPTTETTAPDGQRAEAGATLTENAEKGGLEIRFPAKPDVGTLAALKARGWRWSRFGGCWWVRASDDARAFAAALVG
jgi:hypothetical protein